MGKDKDKHDHKLQSLSPSKVNFLKSLGKSRVRIETCRNLISDRYNGLLIDDDLAYRTMRKGREEAWGKDDNESLLVLYNVGVQHQPYLYQMSKYL